MTKLGVIGGSGLYDIEQMTDVRKERVETPFGNPSDDLILGRVGDREIVFLPRHGIGHYLNPTEVPYRANIHAMKQLGVTHLLSVSAVGSLTERYPPLTLVCPDQIIDRTIHARSHLLRTWRGGARRYRPSLLPGLHELPDQPRGGRRDFRSARRNLRRDRGPAVLDHRRIGAVSLVGRSDHRHDRDAGGPAGT